jgi:hypothetical protein
MRCNQLWMVAILKVPGNYNDMLLSSSIPFSCDVGNPKMRWMRTIYVDSLENIVKRIVFRLNIFDKWFASYRITNEDVGRKRIDRGNGHRSKHNPQQNGRKHQATFRHIIQQWHAQAIITQEQQSRFRRYYLDKNVDAASIICPSYLLLKCKKGVVAKTTNDKSYFCHFPHAPESQTHCQSRSRSHSGPRRRHCIAGYRGWILINPSVTWVLLLHPASSAKHSPGEWWHCLAVEFIPLRTGQDRTDGAIDWFQVDANTEIITENRCLLRPEERRPGEPRYPDWLWNSINTLRETAMLWVSRWFSIRDMHANKQTSTRINRTKATTNKSSEVVEL